MGGLCQSRLRCHRQQRIGNGDAHNSQCNYADRNLGCNFGSPNLDFADAGGDSCAINQSYAANATCTVNVSFVPRFAGTRYGAVVLSDASGVLATLFVEGTGLGP